MCKYYDDDDDYICILIMCVLCECMHAYYVYNNVVCVWLSVSGVFINVHGC